MSINPAAFHKSQHLDESKLAPPDPKCPFCDNTNRQQEYRLQKTPEVLLLQCNACHAVSASRMPTDEALTEYYDKYYDSPASQKIAEQVTFDAPERLANTLANMYFRYRSDASVSILDYGGGDGTISHLTAMQLVKRGVAQVDITVVDYSDKLVHQHDSRITIKKVSSLTNICSLYDLIIASAVIEHHPCPGILLRDLLQCMENGGLFYARTPYILPIMKLFKIVGIKVDFTYPAHIHDLGQEFWENYFTEEHSSRFQILKSKPSIVQTIIAKHFLNTIAAHLFKMPWYLFGKSYKYVGGWEVYIRKR